MTLIVRLFARAKDLAGTDAVTVVLPPRATVAELRNRIALDYPALARLLERSALAVDEEFAQDAMELKGNHEIALLPPVSGG
jgi:molybdopterin converting factor subunit 1